MKPRRATLRRWTRWVACGDSHGDNIDAPTYAAFKDFVREWKPHRRVHGGDIWDFRWLRRAASDEEKAEAIATDFTAGLDFLSWYRPTDIALGNHDARLWNTLESTTHGATKALLTLMLDRISEATEGVNVVPYDKRRGVLNIGNVRVVHGYGSGIGAVRKAALVYGNCLVFHLHRNEQHTCERLDRATATAVGALCKIDLPYNRATLGSLMHENGWSYGITSPTGQTAVWLAQRVGGKFLCVTGLAPP